jgi:hypothetical protein
MLVRATKSLADGTFCAEFLPVPEELVNTPAPNDGANAEELKQKYGASDWYWWCVNNWGTKWDISPYSADNTDGVVSGNFDTAWSPPVALYNHLQELGFNVHAYYYEPGCGFAGVYSDGVDDCYDLSGLNSTEAAEQLPPDLDQEFCISDNMAEFDEDENDEE